MKTAYHENKTKLWLICLLVAIVIAIPSLTFYFAYSRNPDDLLHTCNILQEYRIPCGPPIADLQQCTLINCCYNEKTQSCYHTLPSKYQYKSTDKDWKDGFTPLLKYSPFNVSNTEKVYLKYEFNEDILKFSLNIKPYRYARNIIEEHDKYYVNITTEEMGFEIYRKTNNKTVLVLATTHGPTIISEKYWEWTINLNTNNLYGLDQFHFEDNQTVTRVIYPNLNNNGILPNFMAENDGIFHGIYIEHNGPLEVTVLPSKLIILRMLSGEEVNVHLSLGPDPSDIWRQQVVSHVIPPFWALGVHICR